MYFAWYAIKGFNAQLKIHHKYEITFRTEKVFLIVQSSLSLSTGPSMIIMSLLQGESHKIFVWVSDAQENIFAAQD